MKRRFLISLLVSLVSFAVLSRDADNPFAGRCGNELRAMIAALCTPERLVDSPLDWFESNLSSGGRLTLPFDGTDVNVVPYLPEDVATLSVLPVDWWRFDGRFTEGLLEQRLRLDLINCYPASTEFKLRKGLYPPAELQRVKWTNGASTVGYLTVDGVETNGWTPPEEMKGDVARAIFYLATVYFTPNWDSWAMLIMDVNEWPAFTGYGLPMLLQWSRNDPVSDAESRRNRLVMAAQGAFGNPFVLWPGLEEYIWGTYNADPFPDNGGGTSPTPEGDDNPPANELRPLRASYSLSDEFIDLWSPYVADDASWSVNGIAVNSARIRINEIGLGRHILSFTDPRGVSGKVIITVKQ